MRKADGARGDPILFASFAFPAPMRVERNALGLTVEGRIGAATVTTRVPVRQEPDSELDMDDLSITMREQRGEASIRTSSQVLRDWDEVPIADAGQPIELRRLLLRVESAANDLGESRPGVGPDLADRLCDEIFRFGNRWHDHVRSWVEVMTLQDLDHLHPRWTAHVEGAGIATFTPDGLRFGSGGVMRLDTDWPTPATSRVMETALRAAGEDRYPPLAHLLLRDARAAWYREQARRAVIDAATATEVSLSAVADRAGLLPQGKFLTLGSLLKMLRSSGHLALERTDELFKVVVIPRNKAVHEGAEPSSWEAAEACKAAQLQVWEAFPL